MWECRNHLTSFTTALALELCSLYCWFSLHLWGEYTADCSKLATWNRQTAYKCLHSEVKFGTKELSSICSLSCGLLSQAADWGKFAAISCNIWLVQLEISAITSSYVLVILGRLVKIEFLQLRQPATGHSTLPLLARSSWARVRGRLITLPPSHMQQVVLGNQVLCIFPSRQSPLTIRPRICPVFRECWWAL